MLEEQETHCPHTESFKGFAVEQVQTGRQNQSVFSLRQTAPVAYIHIALFEFLCTVSAKHPSSIQSRRLT